MSRSANASGPEGPDADDTEARLGAACAAAEEQLARLEEEFRQLVADDDTIQEDRDTARQLLEEARAAAIGAQGALERHRDGTYGRCARCGAEIPPERLEVLTDVTTCIGCQGKAR